MAHVYTLECVDSEISSNPKGTVVELETAIPSKEIRANKMKYRDPNLET